MLLLLLARVSSHKYSLDTSVVLAVFQNIFFNHSTFNPIGGINQFSAHFSPILILLSPLYLLGPTVLIFLWKFSCYGAFLIILSRLPDVDDINRITDWHKNLFLMLVALHPTFISNVMSPDIWDSDLILPLLGLSVLFVSRNRYLWGVLFFCLTFLVKEDMMLVGILYGISLAVHAKNVRFLWLSAFSLVWFWITTHFIMTSFSTSQDGLALLRFSFGNLGNSLSEIVINSVFHPSLLISNGYWLRKLASLFIILSCVGFLPFWKRSSLIYALPGLSVLAYTLLAAQPYLDYSKHYMLAFFVFIVWSSYRSYLAIDKDARVRLVLFSVLTSTFIVLAIQINMRAWSFYLTPTDNLHTLQVVKERLIPPGSYLLTGGIGSPWLCYANNCSISPDFSPEEIERKGYEYIFINLRTIFWEILNCSDESMKLNLRKLNANNAYQVLHDRDDIVLLKRIRVESADAMQPDWSGQIEQHEGINHDCVKPHLMKALRPL